MKKIEVAADKVGEISTKINETTHLTGKLADKLIKELDDMAAKLIIKTIRLHDETSVLFKKGVMPTRIEKIIDDACNISIEQGELIEQAKLVLEADRAAGAAQMTAALFEDIRSDAIEVTTD